MSKNLLKRLGLGVIALSLVMGGCDAVQENALTGPGGKSDVVLTSTDDDGYTTVRETNPTVGVVTGVLGEAGGELKLGKHVLQVPAGAVTAPTTFTMTKADDRVHVDLTATRILPNDVGAAGFLKPVRLSLSYHDASNVDATKEDQLKMYWQKLDGTIEAQQSYVDKPAKLVTANLNHFSLYIIYSGDD